MIDIAEGLQRLADLDTARDQRMRDLSDEDASILYQEATTDFENWAIVNAAALLAELEAARGIVRYFMCEFDVADISDEAYDSIEKRARELWHVVGERDAAISDREDHRNAWIEATRRMGEAEARAEGLRVALAPFAKWAKGFGPYAREDGWVIATTPSGKTLTMGDVRAARAALERKP